MEVFIINVSKQSGGCFDHPRDNIEEAVCWKMKDKDTLGMVHTPTVNVEHVT